MRLLLMRHGESPSAVEAGVKSDHERPLSDRGRADSRRQAGRLKAKGLAPDLILASPLRRAQQTAAELRRALGGTAALKTYEPLANQTNGEQLWRRLADDGPWPGLTLLVGHMPQLGELASCLVGTSMGLQTAELAAVEGDGPGRCRLCWSAAPGDPPEGPRG